MRFCFVDLYNIRSEEEFYQVYSRELIKASATKWEERVLSVKLFFKRIVPQISLPLDPQHDISLSFEWKKIKQHPDEIINLAENICIEKKIKLVVCIDEFQNISFFKEPLVFQKKLRAHWQRHQKATYCIYGSKRQMMATIFENASMPFYKFGDVVFLKKIERKYWISFITSRFKKTGKNISGELADEIADRMEDHPYFVQQLAMETWQHASKTCTEENLEEALQSLLSKLTILYQRETDLLSNGQVNFLRAMCAGETQFSSKNVIEKYQLGTSANSVKIKKALEQKEVIDSFDPAIQFSDPLFKWWFMKFMIHI